MLVYFPVSTLPPTAQEVRPPLRRTSADLTARLHQRVSANRKRPVERTASSIPAPPKSCSASNPRWAFAPRPESQDSTMHTVAQELPLVSTIESAPALKGTASSPRHQPPCRDSLNQPRDRIRCRARHEAIGGAGPPRGDRTPFRIRSARPAKAGPLPPACPGRPE